VIEISVGDPSFNGNSVRPNNVTVFDAADYILKGRYNNRLTGLDPSGTTPLNPMGPRKAYTGTKGPHHVQITLRSFAGGQRHNLANAPVYIRFRMTSDAASANGLDSGWFVDNLVVHNLGSADPTPTPTPTPTPSPGPTPTSVFQFSFATYAVNEDCTFVNATVIRGGVTDTRATVDIASNDGTAKQKGDYTFVVGRIVFEAGETQKAVPVLISEDAYTEGVERATLVLQNPQNGTLGTPSNATLEIVDDSPENTSSNPIDVSRTFVCQHYHDFLYRHSDPSGEDFWTNNIEACGADAQCRQVFRVNVSQAFFLSIEFKETGYLVVRAHKAAFGSAKSNPRYQVFLRDQRQINEGLIVGQGNWQQQLETNKQNYLTEFVSRSDFVTQFPQGESAAQYVDKLFANAAATPTTAERNAAIAAYGSGDTAGRAAALRSVIESGAVFNAQYNPAAVLMQYFGYLRRNPDDSPDNNFVGYDFWLNKLNSFSLPGEDMRNDQQAQARLARAEMVRAFIEAVEYRHRFFGEPSGNQLGSETGAMARVKGWVNSILRSALVDIASG
jgi:Calx-beta domain